MRKLVNRGILEQSRLWGGDTPARHDYLYDYLNPLAGLSHLLMGSWLAGAFI